MSVAPCSASDEAARWARTLAGLVDPSVRIGWVRSRVLALSVSRATDVLAIVHARAEQREPAFSALLLCVCVALQDAPLGRTRSAIGALAEARGLESLAALFPPEDGSASSDEDADPTPHARVTVGAERPLSLGERKSLARRRDRNLLARALRDPHPDVIAVLLDNPALVEADVVRLCARRPISADILARVFQHKRWILRPAVRRTLVLNPHTPEPLALQLLPQLTLADLREVAGSLQLSEAVRRASRLAGEGSSPVH